MQFENKRYLVCDCRGTMSLGEKALARACGAEGGCTVHHELCGADRAQAEQALSGEQPVVVACMQQAPLFRRLGAAGGRCAPLGFADIRESAGWTDQADASLPKMAALLAAAAVEAPPAETVTLSSAGRCLVYGRNEVALEAAGRLSRRLDVTLLLDRAAGGEDVLVPSRFDLPVYGGRIVHLGGHLGAFEVTVDGHAEIVPSSRGTLAFGPPADGVETRCDLVVDLSGGPPLLSGASRRDGYLRPDPRNPAAVERALFDAADLVGEFEKPRYVAFRPDLCAHSRNGITGCTRCLDSCPVSAIRPDRDTVAIDAAICDGCGTCHAVCPTGAATYAGPGADAQLERLRALLVTYRKAGGAVPVLLLHDMKRGTDAVRLMAHFGRGLPANVLPFAVSEITRVGPDLLLPALAFGAARIVILADPAEGDGFASLHESVAFADTVVAGLGYGEGLIRLWEEIDPEAVEARLYEDSPAPSPASAGFSGRVSARDAVRLALGALHEAAPARVDAVPLAAGAPFGRIEVDRDACTLCLACVAVCPTGALGDNTEKPQLRFTESACVQCGLCRATCPEDAIALDPRINFGEEAGHPVVLNEEEPFNCIRCGKPFGTRSSVERVIAQLAHRHPMFRDAEAVARMRMCGDCRVKDQFENRREPMRGAPPPRARTAEDDLAEEAVGGPDGGNDMTRH